MVELTLPLVVGAALVDSINPCVIGVLVFLLTYMTKVFKSAKEMLFISTIYTVVVYITYFLLGLGIFHAVLAFEATVIFYTIAAVVAAIAGILELKDFFWYGKGLTLQILPEEANRLKYYTRKFAEISRKNKLVGAIFATALGVFVVMIELPCTGAPYFAILGLLSQGSYAEAVPWLLLYNFIFVVPLLIVIAMAFVGHSLQKMDRWKDKHKKYMRLFMGLFLIGLAAYMLYSVYFI